MALTKNNANTFYKNLKVNFKRIERLQLGDVVDLEALTFNLALMFIRNPNVQFSTEPAILPNCCYRFVAIF
ncbi:hypothetical protein [Flavobacterium psychraquaticum]|uniref:hypothetical protein n=1 Tax=Flavobacterium psychraquaticum TaxID=3103958 RepID=UPI002ACE7662|nr:hypothetical protein [Flavobacterium sp. LB-N7T]